MKEQTVVITDTQYEIERLIREGWRVISVTAGHIATGSSFTSHGKFCFILER